MATIITGVTLLRWQSLNAMLMFLANMLDIRLRKSDYISLAVTSSDLGLVFAYWSATELLGMTLVDMFAIWKNTEAVTAGMMSRISPD